MTSFYFLGISWHGVINWFLGLLLFWQILIVGSIIAIAIIVIIITYYILKGVWYLIYYPIKGIWWLLKRIFGKHEPKTQGDEIKPPAQVQSSPESDKAQILEKVPTDSKFYCPKCGNEFTNSMNNQLKSEGFVYCVFCGNGVKKKAIEAIN